MPDVYMPRLSDSMDEGTILRWLKNSGDQVRRGEEFVEIETDKATVAFEAEHDGVLEIVAARGSTCAVGRLIAYIGEPSISAPDAGGAEVRAEAPASAMTETGVADPRSGSGAVDISPTARRLAEAHRLDLGQIQGTGPGGRITRADVSAAITTEKVPTGGELETGAAGVATSGKGDVTRQALSRAQETTARRMAESSSTVPDFALEMDVEMDSALEALRHLRIGNDTNEARPTLTDLIVKASGRALREFPVVNGAYRDGGFEHYSRVNVGIAVAADHALLVPTVFDADQKTVMDIARESRRLAARARDGSISPGELSNATFTVSNLGMYGVRAFHAVINPPQSAILAVGALRTVPAVAANALTTRQELTLTLACDHRILYGAEAAQFLARLAGLLREPDEWCIGPAA